MIRRALCARKGKKHFQEEGILCCFKMLLIGQIRWRLSIIFSNIEVVSGFDKNDWAEYWCESLVIMVSSKNGSREDGESELDNFSRRKS